MPAATYYMEVEYEHFGVVPGVDDWEFMQVGDSLVNQVMTLVGFRAGPPVGWGDMWYTPPLNGLIANGVRHVFTQAHTPLAETTEIDGTPLNFNPAVPPGYIPYMIGLQAQHFYWGWTSPNVLAPAREGRLYKIKIGSSPGGSDFLNWNAATDGFGPLTSVGGNATLVGDHIRIFFTPGDLVTFDFVAPWPPTLTFNCSFQVGATRVAELFSLLPPPDDVILVQGALPETLLPEGYRIEVGAYNPDGTPFTSSSERNATLGFSRLEDQDE